MRIIPEIILCGIASLLLSGCASAVDVTETGADANPPRFTEPVQAFCSNDYAKLKASLSSEMRERMTEKRFHAAYTNMKKFGAVSKVSYITTVRQSVTFSELWKIVLVRKNAAGEKIITEKILRIIGGKSNETPTVLGLMLQ